MDERMDGRTEFLPILQDFVPCWGRCPATFLRLHNIKEAGQGNRWRLVVLSVFLSSFCPFWAAAPSGDKVLLNVEKFRPSVHLSVPPSIHPSIHLSVCLSICPSIHPSVHPSVHPHNKGFWRTKKVEKPYRILKPQFSLSIQK